mgnify:CR=1 FL=1
MGAPLGAAKRLFRMFRLSHHVTRRANNLLFSQGFLYERRGTLYVSFYDNGERKRFSLHTSDDRVGTNEREPFGIGRLFGTNTPIWGGDSERKTERVDKHSKPTISTQICIGFSADENDRRLDLTELQDMLKLN